MQFKNYSTYLKQFDDKFDRIVNVNPENLQKIQIIQLNEIKELLIENNSLLKSLKEDTEYIDSNGELLDVLIELLKIKQAERDKK